eukprot:SAG31_NODE_1342_length_8700_cov_12.667829_11_plen_241_part_00
MLQLWSIVSARQSFVGSTVVDLESSHPDVVEEMLASSVQLAPIGADGVCRSRSGSVLWAPRVSAAQLTEVFGYFGHGYGSAAAFSIAGADSALTWGEPYCAEMPAAMLELIKAEPNGAVGQSYRRYVRMALLPGVRLVGEILQQHGATIGASACLCDCPPVGRANHVQPTLWHAEWPSLTWLKEKHPARVTTEPADAHALQWLAYIRASEVLLAAWDEGVFVDMVPGAPLPLLGMIVCIE